MDSIEELVRTLQQPGLDMFAQRELREKITSRTKNAVRDLLALVGEDPSLVEGLLRDSIRMIRDDDERTWVRNQLECHIGPPHSTLMRSVCMRMLASHFPKEAHVGTRLLDFASCVDTETRALRLEALKAVAKFHATQSMGNRMLRLLRDKDPEIVAHILEVLPAYQHVLPADDVVPELERLIGPHANLDNRCIAIELLGRFGEIDVFERVCLLPLHQARERLAVQAMVEHLLRKPRSVLALSPSSFEKLVGRLLEKMTYQDVVPQQKASWDEGVDVTAWFIESRVKGPERVKMIGQCKRYQRTKLVGPDVVSKMVESVKKQEAGRGVIITTSAFQPAALELARQYRHIELINGDELQVLLGTHFETTYRVRE